ncbi:MAG: ATP-binding protein [Humidesulfovibrio sp.]|uniref:two-component system sensor histidine kinase NtrB n=1 Tax=Humidesulfovibrio sp. TaxID=2910988 RepID=UPI0027ECB6B1|nr:ATP-binding protein [Humidesulfovibrio sp.]MDQ7834590.1 ATP-binding protein [Humidesulfovibrio sp.]
MELRSFNKDKGPLLAAVVALLILGAGSIFLTWQNIRRQRELVDQHLLLSAGAVLHGVEANLMRIMHSMARSPDMGNHLFPTIKEFFQEITASGDIVFLGVFADDGSLVVASTKDDTPESIALPEEILAELETRGHWEGPLRYQGKTALFAALRARPSLSRICSDVIQGVPILPPEMRQRGPGRGPGSGMGRGRGGGMGLGMGAGGGRGMMPPPDEPGTARMPEVPSMFLVAALSPSKHLAQFNAYRRAALLQTGYVLGAAAVLWFLALAYLSRRNQALKAARLERFHSKLLDNMPDGLLTLGPGGLILSANGSAARLLLGDKAADAEAGAEGDLTGRNFRDFPFAEMAATDGTSPDQWRQYEHDGRLLEVLCLPLQTEDGTCQPPCALAGQHPAPTEEKLVLLRDRTRMKSLEDDLAEAKRLAAIGSLAAGVAHEIRNPLSSLRGFAQLFATKLKGQEPLSSYACTMVQEADRLNRVVTDLLYLARPRELAPDPIDLTQVVESLHGLLRFDLEAKGVTPRLDLAETRLCADQDGLKQALLNLMVNALDALPENDGSLTLASRRSSPADGVLDGPGVWVSVTDNGHGMDEAVRNQAFEPFFTAKRQGTGLGLAIVQGIMRAHKGRALIDSTPGEGTTVRLFFPDCPDNSAPDDGGDDA